MGIGKVAGASFGPAATAADGAGLAGAAEADLASDDGFPLPLPGDGDFGLAVGEVAGRAPEAGGGVVEPEADFPADFDEAPRASAAVRSEDLSLSSGVSSFLVSDFGLGSTLSRMTVSG